MAIQTIVFADESYICSHKDLSATLQLLYEYLIANAVPKYFDSVTIQSDKSYLSCFIGGVEFLRIENNTAKVIVTTSEGTTMTFVSSSAGSPRCFSTAYECSEGITFNLRGKLNEQRASISTSMTITKDSAGNTTIICAEDMTLASNTAFVIPSSAMTITSFTFVKQTSKLTALTQIPTCCSEGTFLPNVYLLSFTQNTTRSIITINDIQFLSNGVWCVRDK